MADFKKELKVMHGIRHPCIVGVLGAVTGVSNELSIVMEYADRSDLRGILDHEYSSLDARRKNGILYDVSLGMQYLYGLKVRSGEERSFEL